MRGVLKYLGAPYSTGLPDKVDYRKAMDERAAIIARNVAKLHEDGVFVYSPITHGYGYERYVKDELRPSHDFWLPHCFEVLRRCDSMLILQLEGWDRSFGIREEIHFCNENNIPVEYLEPYYDSLK